MERRGRTETREGPGRRVSDKGDFEMSPQAKRFVTFHAFIQSASIIGAALVMLFGGADWVIGHMKEEVAGKVAPIQERLEQHEEVCGVTTRAVQATVSDLTGRLARIEGMLEQISRRP